MCYSAILSQGRIVWIPNEVCGPSLWRYVCASPVAAKGEELGGRLVFFRVSSSLVIKAGMALMECYLQWREMEVGGGNKRGKRSVHLSMLGGTTRF